VEGEVQGQGHDPNSIPDPNPSTSAGNQCDLHPSVTRISIHPAFPVVMGNINQASEHCDDIMSHNVDVCKDVTSPKRLVGDNSLHSAGDEYSCNVSIERDDVCTCEISPGWLLRLQ
jgi:hypothetical protein